MYYESYLHHHGIKGQKWGKQNGPPYPLDRQKRKEQKKDFKKLNKVMSKASKLDQHVTNTTKTYYNESTGNTIEIVNIKNKDKADKYNSKAYKFTKQLSEKYSSDVYKSWVSDDGKIYVETKIGDLTKTMLYQDFTKLYK